MVTTGKKRRLPQAERRGEVLKAALIEFGKQGYDGTSTSMIADRAGIQQPYIYALFENKRHLFLACHDELVDRILATFSDVVEGEDSSHERLRKMGLAYLGLLDDDDGVRCHLQVFAAAGHDDLRDEIRAGFERTFEGISELSGADPSSVAHFFATGMMLNMMKAIGEPAEMMDHLKIPREG
jgi:AcrR family transcriptional regulator